MDIAKVNSKKFVALRYLYYDRANINKLCNQIAIMRTEQTILNRRIKKKLWLENNKIKLIKKQHI